MSKSHRQGKRQRPQQKQNGSGQRQQTHGGGFGKQTSSTTYSGRLRAITALATEPRAMFLAEYHRHGRFAALVDTARSDIPFIPLSTLQTPKAGRSIVRELAGEALVSALQDYDPENEGLLLHTWDVVDPFGNVIDINAQIRKIVFSQDGSSTERRPEVKFKKEGPIATLQAVLLVNSEPIGPVMSVSSMVEAEPAAVVL